MFRIRVLGTLEAEDESGAIDLGGPRQRGVLALLLVARGDVVSVDRMIEDLWHGESPPSAVAALQAYISRLRRVLEPGRTPRTGSSVLISHPPGYALHLPSEAVDAWQFDVLVRQAAHASDSDDARRSLERALALWKGPAYASVAGESWADAEMARLEELRLVARERLTAAILRAGDAAAAVTEAQSLTREQPLREEGWRLLALALHASSRRADALAALRRVRTVLADELGLDPGPELTALESEILSGAGPPNEPRPRRPAPPEGTTPEAAGPFVGRTAELAELCDEARDGPGPGRVILLVGEAGSGKTALLQCFRSKLAELGWRTALGRCPEAEGAPPAWAWVEALSGLATDVDPGPLTPALAPLLDDQHVGQTDSDAAVGHFLLHRAVCDYLAAAAANRPLAIILDDIHRGDEETLALLANVAGQIPHLLVVASYRPDEAAPPLQDALARLARSAPTRLLLDGLAPEEGSELVRRISGVAPDTETLAALADRTEGNPFYLRESARLLASEGALVALADVPQGVRDVLRRRFARLPEVTVSVLRLAAVVGRDAEIELVIRAAEVDEATVLDALEEGVLAGLLQETVPGAVRFTHALVRDTLVSDVLKMRRSRWHARIAAALEQLHPDDHAALAHHFTQSLSPANARRTVAHNIAAARQAAGRYAHDAAIGFFEAALAAMDRLPSGSEATADEHVELLSQLSRTQVAASAGTQALSSRNRAVAIADRAGRTDLLIRALTAWDTPALWRNRRYGEVNPIVVGLIENTLRNRDLEATTRCRLLVALVGEICGEDDERAQAVAWEAESLARASGDPRLLGLALAELTLDISTAVPEKRRRELGAELIELGSGDGLAVFAMIGHDVCALLSASRGNLDAAGRHIAGEGSLAARYQWRQAEATAAMNRGLIAHITGELAHAEHEYLCAHAIFKRSSWFDADGVLALVLLTLRLTEGRVGELEAILRAVDTAATDVVSDPLALAMVANGKVEEARRVREQVHPVRKDFFRSLWLSIRGMALSAVGERFDATETYPELLDYRGELGGVDGGPYTVGPVDTILGDLALLLDRPANAEEHYRAGLALAERCGNRYWISAARERLGFV